MSNDQKDRETIVQRWRLWSKFLDESTMKWRRKWWTLESNRSNRKATCFFLSFSWCSFSFSTIRNMSRNHSRISCFVWRRYTFDQHQDDEFQKIRHNYEDIAKNNFKLSLIFLHACWFFDVFFTIRSNWWRKIVAIKRFWCESFESN